MRHKNLLGFLRHISNNDGYRLLFGWQISLTSYDARHAFSTSGSPNNGRFTTIAIYALMLNYVLPILLNPITFLCKIDRFLAGIFVYLLCIPAMLNILGIYSV